MRPRDFSTVPAAGGGCGGGKHLLRNPIINCGFNLGLIAFDHTDIVAVLGANSLSCVSTQQARVECHGLIG